MNLDFTQSERKTILIPEDKYQAVLAEVRDLGLIQGKYDETPVPKVEFWFQTEPIEVTTEEGEKVTKRFTLKTFPEKISKDDRSKFYKIVAALMGGKIDPNVKSTEELVGNNVELDIVNKPNKEGVMSFNNIQAVYKVKTSKLRELQVEDYKKKGEDADFAYGANASDEDI